MKQKNFFEFEVDDEAKGINVESLRKSKAIREQFINDFGFVPTSIIKRDVKEQMSLTRDKVLEERGGGYNQHHKGMMHKIRTSKDYVPNLEKFGMRLQGRTGCLSRFPQNIGRLMIDLYCPEDGVILDLFAGHNSRLELSAYRCGRDYIGVDCCAEFMKANRELVERKEKINTMGVRKTGKVTLIEGSSHKVDLPDNLADFSITSPPYYCLTPETLIVTKNEIKQIENVGVGDLVLSHKGRWCKVNKTFSRDIHEDILSVKIYGCSVPLEITKNHKVYAVKTTQCPYAKQVCVENCGYLRSQNPNWNFKKCGKFYKDYKPKFIKANDLNEGDYICFPIDKTIKDVSSIKISDFVDLNKQKLKNGKIYFSPNQYGQTILNDTILINDDFMRLAGYYVAEGCITTGEINFTFSEKETEYIEETEELFIKIFGIKLRRRKGTSAIHLVTYNTVIKELFTNLFYRYSYNVKAPDFFMQLPTEKQKQFLITYWYGDGCVTETKFERVYSAVTTSINLASQLRQILHRLGIFHTFQHRKVRDNKFNDKIVARHPVYSVSIRGKQTEKMDKLFEFSSRYMKTKSRNFGTMITDDFVGYRIQKNGINKKEYKGGVYNLEVEKDNSYTLIQGNVHNCQEYYGPEKEQLGFERDYETFLNTLYLHVKENKRILKEGAFCVWFINDFRKDGKYHAFHIDLYNLFIRAKFEPHNIYIVDLVNTVQTCFVQDIIKNKVLPKQHEYILVMRKPMEEKDE